MTWFLTIMPLSEPADVGEDAAGLRNAVFEVLTTQENSSDTLAELGSILETAGVGVVGTSILFTSGARLSRTPTIVLKDAGGQGHLKRQDDLLALQRITTRVVASATTQRAARDLAWAAYRALEVVLNQEV